MDELLEFGKLVLIVGAGFSLALASTALSARFPLPRRAIFLFAAALASDLFPALGEHVSIREAQRARKPKGRRFATSRSTSGPGSVSSSATARRGRRAGRHMLQPGDEVLVLTDTEERPVLRRLFEDVEPTTTDSAAPP